MIDSVTIVTVNVSDLDKAHDFFVNKLGFKVKTDYEMPGGYRWLEIATPKGDTSISLNKVESGQNKEDKSSGLFFQATDIQATYKELVANGVEFKTVPEQQPWGWWSEFKDSDGNIYHLSQSATS